jgi:hypothetical protein
MVEFPLHGTGSDTQDWFFEIDKSIPPGWWNGRHAGLKIL